jgi:hypothetical protein
MCDFFTDYQSVIITLVKKIPLIPCYIYHEAVLLRLFKKHIITYCE